MLVLSEKMRGAFMSLISGLLAGGLTFVGVKAGMSASTSSAMFLYGVGSILAYSMDILFAKANFPNLAGKSVALPYTNLLPRVQYLARSFLGPQFLRFIVTMILDTLIGIALLRAAIKFMNEKQILMDFKYRNTIASILIATITFVLFVNVLRFDWAYNETNNMTLNVIIYTWLTIVLLMFAITYVGGDATEANGVKVGEVSANVIPVVNRWGVTIYDLS